MRENDRPEIRKIPLFRTMQPDNFERLMDNCYAQNFPAHLELVRQGDPADFLHIVVEGSVELFASWNGRDTTMGVVQPVGAFIVAACIRDAPYLMTARTMERSRLILLPAVALRAMFREDTEFAVTVVNELAMAYRLTLRQAKGLKLRTSRERIAAYFIRQSQQAGGALSYVLPVEKRMLASFLGMTPENLSRTVKSLEPDGVKVVGQRIVITDRDKLAALAQLDPLLDGPDPEDKPAGIGLPNVKPTLPVT